MKFTISHYDLFISLILHYKLIMENKYISDVCLHLHDVNSEQSNVTGNRH